MLSNARRLGYWFASLSDVHNGRRATPYVHQLVAQAFLGPPPNGCEVGHLDGSRDNNRVENLAWVTKHENQMHRHGHGTFRLGREHPMGKLSDDDVREIKRLRSAGLTLQQIADRFGITFQHVSAICRDKVRNR